MVKSDCKCSCKGQRSRSSCICQGHYAFLRSLGFDQGYYVFVKVTEYLSRSPCICQGHCAFVKVTMHLSRSVYTGEGDCFVIKVTNSSSQLSERASLKLKQLLNQTRYMETLTHTWTDGQRQIEKQLFTSQIYKAPWLKPVSNYIT